MTTHRMFLQQHRDSLVQWHARVMPLHEQATRLGVTRRVVSYYRHRLAAQGLITFAGTCYAQPRQWTQEEVYRLDDLRHAGKSVAFMARALGRTTQQVHAKLRTLGKPQRAVPNVYTASEAARRLGVDVHTVVTWITRGWLPATNISTGTRPTYKVQRQHIIALLGNYETWMAWSPDRITDRDLRERAHALRTGQPRWLSSGMVAERFCVAQATVDSWIMRGALTGGVRYKNW